LRRRTLTHKKRKSIQGSRNGFESSENFLLNQSEIICPRCKKDTLSVSDYSYFFECSNCAWKGLHPTSTRPTTKMPLGRTIALTGLIMLGVFCLIPIAIIFRINQGVTTLITIAIFFVLFVFGYRWVWSTPSTKWRLGKLTEKEINSLNKEDLELIYKETNKFVKNFKRSLPIVLCILLIFVVVAVIFHSAFFGGLGLLVAISIAVLTPVQIPQYRQLKRQSQKLSNRISELNNQGKN
jgi:cell division protein FtsB